MTARAARAPRKALTTDELRKSSIKSALREAGRHLAPDPNEKESRRGYAG